MCCGSDVHENRLANEKELQTNVCKKKNFFENPNELIYILEEVYNKTPEVIYLYDMASTTFWTAARGGAALQPTTNRLNKLEKKKAGSNIGREYGDL